MDCRGAAPGSHPCASGSDLGYQLGLAQRNLVVHHQRFFSSLMGPALTFNPHSSGFRCTRRGSYHHDCIAEPRTRFNYYYYHY